MRDIDTADLLKLFSEDELDLSQRNSKAPWEYMDKAKWNNLLRRQLSGDPSKINPELSLNQQVSALAYNPRLEIDRSNFTVGAMLGSGHFGSVYVGEATGVFHAGSKTTVKKKIFYII